MKFILSWKLRITTRGYLPQFLRKQEEWKPVTYCFGQADLLIPLGKVARESAHFLVSTLIVKLNPLHCHDYFVFPVKSIPVEISQSWHSNRTTLPAFADYAFSKLISASALFFSWHSNIDSCNLITIISIFNIFLATRTEIGSYYSHPHKKREGRRNS